MMETKELANRLNEVITRNYDAVAGYQLAAKKTDDNKLKSMFDQKAFQRQIFANDLATKVETMGEKPVEQSSLIADVHRTWMDIKTAFSTGKKEAVLEECIRGEKASLDEYETLLQYQIMSEDVRELIDKQMESITHNLAELETLEVIADVQNK